MSTSTPASSTAQWHLRVWWLAAPIILSNVTVPLVGAVDTAVTGHMDTPEPIAAVALGASIFSLIFWTFGFLKMGTSGSVAQAFGAKDNTTISLTLLRSLIIAVSLGVIIILLHRPLLNLSLWLVTADATIEDLSRNYMQIRIWSAPATLANYVVTGVLIGIQRMRSVFVFQLVLNCTNVILDLLFVPVLGWGIEGVAIASLISEYTALALALYLIREQLRVSVSTATPAMLREAAPLKRLLKLNGDIFIRTLLLVSCFFYFNASSGRFSSTVFAANVILMQLLHICAYALDGFAHAAETLAGQAFGSRNKEQFNKVISTSTIQATVTAIIMSAALYFGGPAVLKLFTNQTDVLAAAQSLLPWMLVLPFLSVWCYQLDGIFIGTTHSREMRNAMIISAGLFLLLTMLLIPKFGNTGLWSAFSLFMIARAVTLYLYYPQIKSTIDSTTEQPDAN